MVLIPPFYLDCVVAIGVGNLDGKFKNIGTGFLYGRYIQNDKEESRYVIYLVTNRHVLKCFSYVLLRFNPSDVRSPARCYDLKLLDEKNAPIWIGHPNPMIDVAVIPINFQALQELSMQANYFMDNHHAANLEKCQEYGISEGSFVYVLGFPMDLVGKHRNTVISRSGSIARIRDTYQGYSDEYLIDAFVFPGNSGGPVIAKPEAIAIKGTKSKGSAFLIGIVKAYVPYRDEAISKQTKETRVIFEENSGLAVIHPVDHIHEVIDVHLNAR